MKIIHYPHWVAEAEVGLALTLRDDRATLRDQVNQGIAQLWQVMTDQGESWLITRVELLDDYKELVVCCYQGCDVKTVTPVIYRCAEEQGFDSIRYHTQRKGLNRLVKPLGFTEHEVIYRKPLTTNNEV